MTDVLISGVGLFSATGDGVGGLWDAMTAQRALPGDVAPELEGRVASASYRKMSDELLEPAAAHVGRSSRAAMTVARAACAQAGQRRGDHGRRVLSATGAGDADVVESGRTESGASSAQVFGAAGHVGALVGADLGATCLSNACAGGAYAIAMGADAIRSGEANSVVAGASEAYSRVTMASFNRLGALDPRGCRPFARDRAGTSVGEGAAAVFLSGGADDVEGSALRILGSGWTCDAHHLTAPDPSGSEAARAMEFALWDAELTPRDIGAIIPHATGTLLSDTTETLAMRSIFGAEFERIAIYSLKALVGHTGSAAGALAVAAATAIIEHDMVPGNVPVGELDPDCDVWLPTEPVALRAPVVMVNAFGFGGHNVSVLVGRR